MKPLPEKFELAMRAQLGNEFPAFVTSLQEPSPVSIRLHPIKCHGSERKQPVPWSKFGDYLDIRPRFTLDPLLHGGCYYVQEASSMFLEQAFLQAVDLRRPLHVLDLCAAPGGKSTHLLSLMNRDSLLVANETIRTRAAILAENIQKWGYDNALVTSNDPGDFRRLPGFFDVIVVDAPCSGEGLFRKDPQAIDEWSPDNVQLCAARQKRILSEVWDALKQDGVLIYSTCTYNELEDEENLRWLNENHAVEFIDLETDPAWGVTRMERNGMIAYRFFPHRTRGEGFFLSVIRKTETTGSVAIRNKMSVAVPARNIQERLNAWIRQTRPVKYFQFQDLIFYTPESIAREAEFLLQQLKIVYAGTNLARVKHDKLIPEHALALSVELNRENFPAAAVTETDALKFLRRDALQLDGHAPGFTLLTYNNVPLGWVNVLSNRVNNMYPADWRIRMAD